MFRRECRICFAGLAMPVFETPKTEPESKARDRDRDRRRRARHDRGSPDRERRGRERRNRTRERSRSKPAPELGTAPKGAAPAPPRRCCTRTGCSKITSGVWSAYQHMMAVHATGEEGQAEREALWDEACRLWPDDPASRGSGSGSRCSRTDCRAAAAGSARWPFICSYADGKFTIEHGEVANV